MGIAAELKRNFVREKARLEGKALSHARMIKQAGDVPEIAKKLTYGIPKPTGAAVRMLDGKPMLFFTDGSIRHAVGKRVTKAARKALKRARRAQKSGRLENASGHPSGVRVGERTTKQHASGGAHLPRRGKSVLRIAVPPQS